MLWTFHRLSCPERGIVRDKFYVGTRPIPGPLISHGVSSSKARLKPQVPPLRGGAV